MSDEPIEALPQSDLIPPRCAECSGVGRRLVGWDEDGNEIRNPCPLCGGND